MKTMPSESPQKVSAACDSGTILGEDNRGIAHSPNRIPWPDAARGLLIAGVVIHHSIVMQAPSPCRTVLLRYDYAILLPFFMQAFFFLSGFCSNFRKPFPRFVRDDFRTLLLPAILSSLIIAAIHSELSAGKAVDIVLHLGARWFLVALALSKIAIWCTMRMKPFLRPSTAIVLSLSGIVLGIKMPEKNILWLFQGLSMSFFVWLGVFFRRHDVLDHPPHRFLPVPGCSFLWLLAVAGFLASRVNPPWFGFSFRLTTLQIPVSVAMALGGIFAVSGLSRLLDKTLAGAALRRLGRASLVVYLVHWEFLRLFLPLLERWVPAAGMAPQPAVSVLLPVLATAASFVVAVILDFRFARWMLGRKEPSTARISAGRSGDGGERPEEKG